MTHWLRKAALALSVGAFAIGGAARTSSAATPKQVDDAVAKAQKYFLEKLKAGNCELAAKRDPKGSQSDVTGWQWGGVTACAVYGALASGVKPSDPRIAPAIDWLAKAQVQGHYASGIRAQTWTFLQEKPAKVNSAADFRLLLNGMHTDAKMLGFYPYYTIPLGEGKNESDKDPKDPKAALGTRQPGWFDRSVSQIAVLGMWACDQSGQEVPLDYWKIVDAAWKKAQSPDGGWDYQDSRDVTATMTLAGVATLYITQDYLMQSQKWDVCKGGVRNEWIERGLAWIDRNASKILSGGVPHPMYALYGVERIGVASGRKYFGTTDWYKVGADYIVKRQGADGSWGSEQPHHNPNKMPETMYATLFLVRGRAPVIMSKLEYHNGNEPPAPAALPSTQPGEKPAAPAPRPAVARGTGGKATQPDPWNERPRDAANFAHWASKQTERYLNWQIVNLRVPSSELHDAPILYLAGSETLVFNDEETAKLRTFVEEGGMILGNADCASPAFSKSFIALGQKLFPKYEFRKLPDGHSIYVDQQYRPAKWRTKPVVEGLSNGVRELMVLIPQADLSRAWQTRSDKTRNELYELMQNIFLYSVDKANLRARGDTYIVLADPNAKVTGSLEVVRIMHGDNPDPEPGAWRRLSAVLLNQHGLKATVRDAKLGEGKLAGAKLAHWTGTSKVTLNPQQEAELKAFVTAGGTLLVDAAGGSPDFSTTAEAALAKALGATPGNFGKILPPTEDVYNQANAKIERFGFRTFAKGKIGGLNAPRVRALEVGGRKAVFFSGEDLTAGMVGQPVDGILGYTPDTATDIARGVALYAAANGKGGPAKPVAAAKDGPAADAK